MPSSPRLCALMTMMYSLMPAKKARAAAVYYLGLE
jgi:hypothetical protein